MTVRLTGVRKAFRGRTVLDDIDLEIRPGRVSAILGPNGSGKTTLIKMVLGLVRPDAGTIGIGGQPINGDHAYRARIGYMPQAARFPENLTGREILAMLEDLRGPGVPVDRSLIDAFDLEPELDKPVRTLSGGTCSPSSSPARRPRPSPVRDRPRVRPPAPSPSCRSGAERWTSPSR